MPSSEEPKDSGFPIELGEVGFGDGFIESLIKAIEANQCGIRERLRKLLDES